MMHPVYSEADVKSVKVLKHPEPYLGDKAVAGMVKLAKWGFDFFSGYQHAGPEKFKEVAEKLGKKELTLTELRENKLCMDDKQWLVRIFFLESIAGVRECCTASTS